MASKEKTKTATGNGRGSVPTVGWEVGITLNMGDYNSLRIVLNVGNIDASSDKATKREAAQAEKSAAILYQVVDNMTGNVLNEAMGEAGSGEVQAKFLRAIANAMEPKAKKK